MRCCLRMLVDFIVILFGVCLVGLGLCLFFVAQQWCWVLLLMSSGVAALVIGGILVALGGVCLFNGQWLWQVKLVWD